ncbi:ATP-binding protein [Streptomyces sp. AK02-01A]|uniref:sensor histidine kinase n=1 Tax=Streptomyces sp. AK02-01A TaxID=3028648 RepID=UPI0029AEABB3|nr:ATP-binding protein [Streptomyces sp. AK02-01A]MDX3854648.1 ATP-binding protein [Streptomyces sp. AK02-01A]
MRPSLRSTAPALLISAAISGLLCVWAVSAAPASARTALGWGAGASAVLLTAAVTVAAHALWAGRQLRERNAVLTARLDQLAAKAGRATEDVRRTVADARRVAADAARSESDRAAAVSACANAAGRMQALATSMLADLREMEHRHTDEEVLGDLLHLDHRTAQAGRLADSIAVLTGARSGRRWARPIVMESILRGAMGRISGYQRVRLHSTSEVAIAGHAAEGVMHALAELLDNAANFSPPTAEVHVYVEEVPAGVVITVEDSGLVMSEVQLRRAERAVSTEQSDLSGLSGTRLGLAVVGRLARKHGLTVSFRPSARGGTGVVMMLPHGLVTEVRTAPPAVRTPAPAPESGTAREPAPAPGPAAAAAPEPAPEPASASASASAELGESGLPKRRRGRTLAAALLRTGESTPRSRGAAESTRSTGSTAPKPATAAVVTPAARFSSFRKAVRRVPPHPAIPPHPEGSPR